MKIFLKLTTIILFPFIIGFSLPDNKPGFFFDDLNPDHLDGPFTGGFGELTCHNCHFDYDINMQGGRLVLDGISEPYIPKKVYQITVTVESERLRNGGFQMTARFEDGTQAGSFDWQGDKLMFTPSISDQVMYLQHSVNGTRPTSNQQISWTFSWRAPAETNSPVIFNIAANAGNDDDSAFGDWIYVKERTLSPKH